MTGGSSFLRIYHNSFQKYLKQTSKPESRVHGGDDREGPLGLESVEEASLLHHLQEQRKFWFFLKFLHKVAGKGPL